MMYSMPSFAIPCHLAHARMSRTLTWQIRISLTDRHMHSYFRLGELMFCFAKNLTLVFSHLLLLFLKPSNQPLTAATVNIIPSESWLFSLSSKSCRAPRPISIHLRSFIGQSAEPYVQIDSVVLRNCQSIEILKVIQTIDINSMSALINDAFTDVQFDRSRYRTVPLERL